MARQAELAVTSFDHSQLKESLIEFFKTNPGFEDINYEGSAINTIIDLLVRNAVYTSFQANMVANESFIQSAQIRGNVSSHAQKLSYVPRSRTASRATVDISVIPADPPTEFVITEKPGLTFLATIDGTSYTFATRDSVTFSYNSTLGVFQALGVEIYQGQYLIVRETYRGEKLVINNTNIDTSTLRVTVDDGEVQLTYTLANSLTELGADHTVYFLSENTRGNYEIEFGKDLIGVEPPVGSIVTFEYINTQDEHANGVSQFVAASTIGDYSNIEVLTTTKSFGGHDRDSIEEIRFLAPRAYQAQNRALGPTDYEILIRESFPFIRSIRVWGGEENDPPRYGNVMIAVIPDAGLEITSTLSNRIISMLQQKAVGSVTPIIVQPNIFRLHLTVEYLVRSGVASVVDESDLESFIKTTVFEYSKTNLRRFSVYYNESELVDQLKNRRDIESVSIHKTVSNTLTSYRNIQSIYEVNFGNLIKPGSFTVTGFRITQGGMTERIKDDGAGNIVYSYNSAGGVTRKENIGTINYETGKCSFITRFIHEDATIVVGAEPEEDNFYTTRNNSIEIESVNTVRLAPRLFV